MSLETIAVNSAGSRAPRPFFASHFPRYLFHSKALALTRSEALVLAAK